MAKLLAFCPDTVRNAKRADKTSWTWFEYSDLNSDLGCSHMVTWCIFGWSQDENLKWSHAIRAMRTAASWRSGLWSYRKSQITWKNSCVRRWDAYCVNLYVAWTTSHFVLLYLATKVVTFAPCEKRVQRVPPQWQAFVPRMVQFCYFISESVVYKNSCIYIVGVFL